MRTYLQTRLKWIEERDHLADIIDIAPDDRFEEFVVAQIVKEASRKGMPEIVRKGMELRQNVTTEVVRLYIAECLSLCKEKTPHHSETLTVKEAAGQLRISARRVYEMCAAGEIQSFKVGRSVRISTKTLEDYQQRTPLKSRRNRCL